MWRGLLVGLWIVLCLLGVTWFEFHVYPGHSYLQGETQLLVPMLERLDTPGFLSRDLVASNPTFALTIYDEITLALHSAGQMSIEHALLYQQLLFRLSAVLGMFLLARALQVTAFASVVLSGAVNAISILPAPGAYVTNPEPTPVSFSFSLILLACGLLVQRRPLLASLAAGVALLYDPVTAAAFWMVLLAACFTGSKTRRHLRPAWPVLLVFALILGNLVQLQSGLGNGPELTGHLSDAIIHLTQMRTPSVWVSLWLAKEIWSYLFLLVVAVGALLYLRKHAPFLTNWLVLGIAISGIVSVGIALALLAEKSQLATAMPPARNLAFTVALSALVCGAASFHAARRNRWHGNLAGIALLLACVCNAQVLDLLHLKIPALGNVTRITPNQKSLAAWAEQKTWGSSMFQFPDAGKQNDPGVFRALSRRALWADWNSGLIAASSEQAGQEWWQRWQTSNSVQNLQSMLPLPIDYYVLRPQHALGNVKPAYRNPDYVVYDALELRKAAHSPGLPIQ